MNVREDRHFQDLIISRNIRESTVTEYARDLNAYCNYLNKTLTELIEEAENEEESRIRMKNRKIKRYLLDYYKHLIDQDLRHSTIKKRLTVIKTVYAEYEIDVPKFRIVENDIPETIYSTDLPGHDEIKLILDSCNKKYQAIFCTMASSGMGRGEIQHLKIKDFFLAVNYKSNVGEISSILTDKHINQVAQWKVIRFKTSMPYVTFSSPESIKLIVEYLLSSERKNIELEDYLFTGNGKNMLQGSSFDTMQIEINRRCKFGKTGYHHYFSSHKLRKFFATTLTKHSVPKIYTDWMLGHKIDKTSDSYFKIDIGALKNEYLRILPYLMFREKVEIHTLETPEYKELKSLRKELNEMKALMDKEREDKISKLPLPK